MNAENFNKNMKNHLGKHLDKVKHQAK